MLGKVALYIVGRHYNSQVMHSLCRMAVAPNSSIGKTDRHFERWGATLLVSAMLFNIETLLFMTAPYFNEELIVELGEDFNLLHG